MSTRLAAIQVAHDRLKVENATLLQRCETQQNELLLRDQETDRRGQELTKVRTHVEELETAIKHLTYENQGARALIEKNDVHQLQHEKERARLVEELGAGEGMRQELERSKEEALKALMNAKDGNTNLQDRVSVITGQLHSRGQELEDVRQVDILKRQLFSKNSATSDS